MKHKKISYYLKGIDIILVILVICMMIALTYLKIYPNEISRTIIISGIVTIPVLFVLSFIALFVLYEFWHVCTEIGNDNSFSLENAKSFHHMAAAGVASEIVFVIKLIVIAAGGYGSVVSILWTMAEMLVAIIFLVLCECLSKLILNAYEMKYENDLTI